MLDDYAPAVSMHGPDDTKAFGGLTPQQYAYCQLRARGVAKLHAYRDAFSVSASTDDTIQDAAYKLELMSRIAQTINRMVLARQPETSLVPLVDKDFVLKGIVNIATKETAKDNVRLRAYELLGKTVGLFKDDLPAPSKPRTIEDIDKELRERLQSMRTIDGAVSRVELDSQAHGNHQPGNHQPAQSTGDRRRKPKV